MLDNSCGPSNYFRWTTADLILYSRPIIIYGWTQE